MTGLVRVLCERGDCGSPLSPWGRDPCRVKVYHLPMAAALLRALVMRLRGWRVELVRI